MYEATQPWPIKLRLKLLRPGVRKWNARVRGATAWMEKPYVPYRKPRHTKGPFPYKDGDYTIIGPECFADDGSNVVSWRGENYYRMDIGNPHIKQAAVNEVKWELRMWKARRSDRNLRRASWLARRLPKRMRYAVWINELSNYTCNVEPSAIVPEVTAFDVLSQMEGS